MRTMVVAMVVALASAAVGQPPDERARSHRLEDLTWVEAEPLMGPETIVVIPVGAPSRPHGPHLTLDTDAILTAYLTARAAEATPVLVAPPITYHHDPALLEYPGSTSVPAPLARDLAAEVARGIARHGPRRFYAIAAAPAAAPPLAEAERLLQRDGILLRHSDMERHIGSAARTIQRQRAGDHAGELETSMMLYVDDSRVDMSSAVRQDEPAPPPFVLTRQPGGRGIYSPAGVWGDATLADREKGRALVEALVNGILADIAALRAAAIPDPRPAGVPATARVRAGELLPSGSVDRTAASCSAGDERTIRQIGERYTTAWRNLDALSLSLLWAELGDMGHPDGSVERTREVLLANRLALFRRREYRSSRHFLQVGNIRCLTPDIAIADGKWELRNVTDGEGQMLPTLEGLFTLVLQRSGEWRIESFRYTIDPAEPQGPIFLPRPGYPRR